MAKPVAVVAATRMAPMNNMTNNVARVDASSLALLHSLFLDGLTAVEEPAVYCVAGIPGSGKSTYVKQGIESGMFPANAFMLDPDQVMMALPEYQEDFEKRGPVDAYERWELPARELAYDMFQQAVVRRFNIIKDMSFSRTENYEKIKELKDKGYQVLMVYIECPVDEALRRAANRVRHTPPQIIRDRAQSLAALLPLYRELADDFLHLDNSNLESPYTEAG